MKTTKKAEEKARERHAHRKTVYKETEELISDKKADNGDTSSIVDMGRTDFVIRPKRKNKPLGSSHEPGTMP